MTRHFRILVLLCSFSLLSNAQNAEVSRNVNLRPNASTENASLGKLTPGAQVQLLELDPTDGFFHVKTEDGTVAWVWGKNIKIESQGVGTLNRLGPRRLYPDRTKTPGLADTLVLEDLTKRYSDNCPGSKPSCTYSQAHRNVPEKVHKAVYDTYNVPKAKRNIKNGEVDHFYPLCAGGSNDIKNLWYQPAANEWKGKDFGFHAKDRLETFVCAQIKSGSLDPKVAYQRMTTDWVKFYLDEGLDDED